MPYVEILGLVFSESTGQSMAWRTQHLFDLLHSCPDYRTAVYQWLFRRAHISQPKCRSSKLYRSRLNKHSDKWYCQVTTFYVQVHTTRDSEVADVQELVLRSQESVRRFDIPMNEFILFQILQALTKHVLILVVVAVIVCHNNSL